MAAESYDPRDLVTLDVHDVDPAGLVGEGEAWAVVLPRDVDDRIGPDVSELLPTGGWRELRSPSIPPGHRIRLFAAPRDGGWALAYLSPNGILSADPGPVAVRPSRAARRAGLTLAWSTESVRASDLAGLTVILTNSAGTRWTVDADDHGYVHGWLITDGRRTGPDSFAYAPVRDVLHDLEPGQSLTLSVDFGPALAAPEPGAHEVEAVLPALDVWTGRHRLTIT